jgi:hypothetical protein
MDKSGEKMFCPRGRSGSWKHVLPVMGLSKSGDVAGFFDSDHDFDFDSGAKSGLNKDPEPCMVSCKDPLYDKQANVAIIRKALDQDFAVMTGPRHLKRTERFTKGVFHGESRTVFSSSDHAGLFGHAGVWRGFLVPWD